MLLYYITNRKTFAGDEPTRRRRLLEKIAEAAAAGIDYIQLREKDLSPRDLESLAQEAMQLLHKLRTHNRKLRTELLINHRTDIALATQAAGVHLRSQDVTPQDVRVVWKSGNPPPQAMWEGVDSPVQSGAKPVQTPPRVSAAHDSASPSLSAGSLSPLIAVSCHSPEEVIQAESNQATFAVFGPVFEKKGAPASAPTGLESLRQACRANLPVLALGGITLQNARLCLDAGAAGIAAIRLFQENDMASIVRQLRTS